MNLVFVSLRLEAATVAADTVKDAVVASPVGAETSVDVARPEFTGLDCKCGEIGVVVCWLHGVFWFGEHRIISHDLGSASEICKKNLHPV